MNQNRPHIYIANVPPWFPSQPYLSVPVLTGYLSEHNYAVVQKDLNLSFYTHLLSEAEIQKQFDILENNIVLDEKYQILIELKDFILSNAPKFCSNLKSNISIENQNKIYELIDLVLKLYAFNYSDIEISLGNIKYNFDYTSPKTAKSYIDSENLFSYLFEKYELHTFKELNIDIASFSITTPEQVIPAFSYIKEIKKHLPQIKVVLGGEFISRKYNVLLKSDDYKTLFDFLFIGDLDNSFIRFIDELRRSSLDLKKHTNILSKSSGLEDYSKSRKPIISITPEFVGLPINNYFSHQTILPVELSRGCYWGKCNFCEINGIKYNEASIESTITKIKKYNAKFGVSNFSIVSSSPSPKTLLKLAERLSKSEFKWSSYLRPEKYIDKSFAKKLYAGGCRAVFVGIESGSQKILDAMNKGLRIEDTVECINHIHNAGILIHGYFMFGYDGENDKDRTMTLNFLEKYKHLFSSMSFTSYTIPMKWNMEETDFSLYKGKIEDESLNIFLKNFKNPIGTKINLSVNFSYE